MVRFVLVNSLFRVEMGHSLPPVESPSHFAKGCKLNEGICSVNAKLMSYCNCYTAIYEGTAVQYIAPQHWLFDGDNIRVY